MIHLSELSNWPNLIHNRGEFNNASARRALVDWYLSLFIMCKAGHQYNERPRALALLNLPQVIIKSSGQHTYSEEAMKSFHPEFYANVSSFMPQTLYFHVFR